ncbi:hypothetical protein CJD36_018645 [Flavipsychrobacter stenotrophus]|uniref:SMP-30/Gluconolactonase/LRE-like region domain-containing protein n=1 Tax=Flavipsychrobacter stenotrophus TaxID=2077091 RepID=A0A2S7SQT3_9BACT|nr:hypothetical protein [Flavipsychrobacter stenotrophus]PQJ09269.1 hypothetical protein CJD36_018645 [Flavipsychrobacter stenotrophus]
MLLFVFGKKSAGQIITLYAGSGSSLGDGGPATNASLLNPSKGAFDKYGNFYIASNLGNRIRKIDISGNITTIAGTGTAGYNGDGILATTAMLKHPTSIAFDTADNLYICEHDGARVRKIDKITGIISTVAGNGILAAGIDGIPATSSALNDPQDICFDKYGNLYVAEYFSSKVRKISPTGIISTFAGNGIAGYSSDGGLADTSSIGGIFGLCSDTTGNIYLADIGNSRIFKVNTGGIITTVAGTNAGISYNGDNIPATTANIDPYDVDVDDTGNLIIADNQNHIVRKVDQLGIIHTIAGNGVNGSGGDGGVATAAQLSKSIGLAFDGCGNLYI